MFRTLLMPFAVLTGNAEVPNVSNNLQQKSKKNVKCIFTQTCLGTALKGALDDLGKVVAALAMSESIPAEVASEITKAQQVRHCLQRVLWLLLDYSFAPFAKV